MTTPLIPVLAIGAAAYQNMTPATMEAARVSLVAEVEKEGFLFDAIFIDMAYTEDVKAELTRKLQERKWEIVTIGSGLRLPAEHTGVLEDVVNLVMTTVVPVPRLGFPTLPEEMVPTFKRLASRKG